MSEPAKKEIGKFKWDPEGYKKIFLHRYRKDPVRFSREVCGVEPCAWQEEFLNRLALGKADGTRVALASGHETGKTFIICVAMLWGVCVFPDCHVYATSATREQLNTRLWGYMQRIVGESAVSLWFESDTVKVVFKHVPGNAIYCQSWSKDKPQAWAGEHCNSAWGVFDECSDIDPAIHEAWSGSAFKRNAFTILMSQPRLRRGALYDAFHANKKDWWSRHISSLESPFSSKAYAESVKSSYGENSDYYRVRVLGLFPAEDMSQMFPEADSKRPEPLDPLGYPVAGLDIAAGGGDKTVLVVRRGNAVAGVHKFDTADHVMLCKAVVDTMGRYGCKVVAADTNGIGYGLGQFLGRVPDLTVVPVIGSQKAKNAKKYHNRRAEAYGRLADAWRNLKFSESGVSGQELGNLARQLAAIRCMYDKDMRIQVVSKLDIKDELGESPDVADALAYSFMASEANAPRDGAAAGGGNDGGWRREPQDVWGGKSSVDLVSGKSSYSIWM
jgi:hypothetical protein